MGKIAKNRRLGFDSFDNFTSFYSQINDKKVKNAFRLFPMPTENNGLRILNLHPKKAKTIEKKFFLMYFC